MGWKMVSEMSGSEVVSEARHLANYMTRCREIGQGMNTKETVRFNDCVTRMVKEKLTGPEDIVEIQIEWAPELARFRSMLVHLAKCGTTREEMSKLFA